MGIYSGYQVQPWENSQGTNRGIMGMIPIQPWEYGQDTHSHIPAPTEAKRRNFFSILLFHGSELEKSFNLSSIMATLQQGMPNALGRTRAGI